MTNICVNFNCNFLLIKRVEKKKKVGVGGAINAPKRVPYNKCLFFTPSKQETIIMHILVRVLMKGRRHYIIFL